MSEATTYAGAKLYISTTAQPEDLDEAGFDALTYTEVKGVGNLGEWSTKDTILSYPNVSDKVNKKQKGLRDGGDPVVEVRRIANDAGQTALRAAAKSSSSYAFKREFLNGDIQYNRGIVGGPERPGGGVEDFVLERFQIGFQQETIEA